MFLLEIYEVVICVRVSSSTNQQQFLICSDYSHLFQFSANRHSISFEFQNSTQRAPQLTQSKVLLSFKRIVLQLFYSSSSTYRPNSSKLIYILDQEFSYSIEQNSTNSFKNVFQMIPKLYILFSNQILCNFFIKLFWLNYIFKFDWLSCFLKRSHFSLPIFSIISNQILYLKSLFITQFLVFSLINESKL